MAKKLGDIARNIGSKLNFLSKFINFKFFKWQGVLVLILLFVGVGAFFMFATPAHAFEWSELTSLEGIVKIIVRILYGICYGVAWIAMKIFGLMIIIASYNDFVDSAAVAKGWTIIRDACNMFYVLILIIVAFGEILNVKSYKASAVLPKLLIGAVLVNFSKVICGLFIDFAQVVMMTFVAGFAATAGGNLIVGLGIQDYMKVADVAPGENSAGIDVYDALAGMMLALGILILVAVISCAICVLLLIRVVYLWILVTISPLYFFLWGSPVGANFAKEWWDSFKNQVTIGPVMAFFLWLALLVMQSPQDMTKSIGTKLTNAQGKAGTTGLANYDKLAQAAIGVALLYGGLMAAQKAGGVGAGMGSKMIGAAKGKVASSFKSAYKAGGEKLGAAYNTGTMYAKKGVGAIATPLAAGMSKMPGVSGVKRKAGAVVGAPGKGLATVGNLAKRGVEALPGGKGALAAGAVIGGKMKKGFDVVGGKMKEGWKKEGLAEQAVIETARNKKNQEKMTESNKRLDALGIRNNVEGMQEGLKNPGNYSQNDRKAMAMELATRGKVPPEFAKDAKKLFGNDKESYKTYETALMGKQAHLAFDQDRLKDPKERDKFNQAVKTGQIDLSKQSHDTLGNKDFIAAYQSKDAGGMKKFNNQAKEIMKGDDTAAKEALKRGSMENAQKRIQDIANGGVKEGDKEEFGNLQNMMLIVGDKDGKAVEQAFGKRDEKNGELLQGSEGGFDDQYAGNLNKLDNDQLAGIDWGSDFGKKAAKSVDVGRMNTLAKSTDAKHQTALSGIVKSVDDPKKLSRIASNNQIMDSLNEDSRKNVATNASSVKSMQKVKGLRSQAKKLEENKNTAMSQLQAAQKRHGDLKNRTIVSPETSGEIVATEKEIEDLKKKIADSERDIEKINNETAKLESESEEMEEEVT